MRDIKDQKLIQIIIEQFLNQKYQWKIKNNFIDIEDMDVENIDFLRDLAKRNLAQNVTEVNLAHNSITDFSSLMSFPLLKCVTIRGNNLKHIPELPIGLTSLDVAYNYLSDIEAISRYQNLTWLDIGNSEIVNITPLKELSKLEGVDLKSNHIKDISPLSSLTTLKKADLQGNQIEDISTISDLINLEELILAGNKITDVSPLGKLTKLEWLTLDGVNITAGDRQWLIETLPNCQISLM